MGLETRTSGEEGGGKEWPGTGDTGWDKEDEKGSSKKDGQDLGRGGQGGGCGFIWEQWGPIPRAHQARHSPCRL